MSNWFQNLNGLEDDADPNPNNIHDLNRASLNVLINKDPGEELEEEEQEESAIPELHAYQDFISKSPAYEWLLATLRKEFLLAPAEPNSMEAVRREILHSLPPSHKVSRKKSPQACKVTFRIKWDPLAFVEEQDYGEEPSEAVKTAITLTGSANDAQALTCGQYLRQTWPLSGEHTIRLLQDWSVVDLAINTHASSLARSSQNSKPNHISIGDLPDSTKLTAWINEAVFMVEVFGTGDSVAEIGEQLAWLGCCSSLVSVRSRGRLLHAIPPCPREKCSTHSARSVTRTRYSLRHRFYGTGSRKSFRGS
jgi:hypothetical protein